MMFFKGYRNRKKLQQENEDLRKALEKEENTTFEDYFLKNTTISTTNGLEVAFKGTELVKIFASSFWDLVKDSDNYLIMDLHSADGKSVEVTIKKKGKLSPQDKLKKVEGILSDLLGKLSILSSVHPDTYSEAKEYLDRELRLRKKYDGK